MVAGFIIRAQLPDLCLQLFLQIANLVAPRDFVNVDSRNYLKQLNTVPSRKMFVCPKEDCQVYLSPRPDNKFFCDVCDILYDSSVLVRRRSFYSYLSMEHQLRKILEDGKFHKLVKQQREDEDSNTVVNCRRYQNMLAQGTLNRQDFTLLLNTDGVQATISSKLSLWPVQICILELPLQHRHKYLTLPLVWLSKKKPKLNEILIPLIKELKKLSEHGLATDLGKFKFHSIICPVDSQARMMMTNMTQYNGAHPCVWCMIEGEMKPKGAGHARFFVQHLDEERRSTRSMLHHARLALENEVAIFGVKGYSIMGELPSFDLVWGYNPEYLHNVCLGVTVNVLDILTCSRFARQDFSIRGSLQLLDERIMKITPTSEMTRLPEKLSQFKNMKASLLRHVLSYYLIPIIHDVATNKVKNTLLLLVYGVRIYLQDSVTEEEERKAAMCIRKFCEKAPQVLHEHVCTYNLHIFSHVPEICREWGALWDTSTFPFESHNGFLMKLSHGTKYQTEQIMRNHQIYVNNVVNSSSNVPRVQELLESLRSPTRRLIIVKKVGDANLFGNPKYVQLTNLERIEVERIVGGRLESTKLEAYTRFSFRGILVHTADYKKLVKRYNCVFKTDADKYVVIKDLLVYKRQQNVEGVVLRCFSLYVRGFETAYDAELNISSADLYSTGTKGTITHFFRLSNLVNKCVCFKVEDLIIVTKLANRFERD
jgi:hypothetical protein